MAAEQDVSVLGIDGGIRTLATKETHLHWFPIACLGDITTTPIRDCIKIGECEWGNE